MEKVVKKTLGYAKPKDNEPFTHIIFTADEYTKNENDLSNLRDNIKWLEKEYDRRVAVYKASAEDKIAEIIAQANERIAAVQAEMNKHKQKAEDFENANKNLIRVATERANAQRGLTPKKQHIGYVFLNIDQYIYNCECHVSGFVYSRRTRSVSICVP